MFNSRRETGGYSATATAALPHQVRLDKDRPAPDGQGGASPDDPALTDYWATRRRKAVIPLMDRTDWHLLVQQNGACPACGNPLLYADHLPSSPTQWEQWLRATRKALTRKAIVPAGSGTPDEPPDRLLHAHCHRRLRADTNSGPQLLTAREP